MSCGALRTSLTSGPKGQKVNCLGIQWVLFSPKRLTRIGQSSNVFLKQALSLTQILIHFTAHPLTQLNKQSFTVQSSSTVAAGYVWSLCTHVDTLLCAHRRCLPYLKFVRGTGWERKHWTQLFTMLKLVTKVRGPSSALLLPEPAACNHTTPHTQFGHAPQVVARASVLVYSSCINCRYRVLH